MSPINIILFGTPRIYCDDTAIEFARRKALALIAYLAVTDQRHSRDTLAEFLWPDNDAVQSRAALRRVLHTINDTPLAPWIDADRDTISLAKGAGLSVDVRQFDACLTHPTLPDSLEQAIDLYRDNFMAGFTLRDSAAFDHWQASQSQHLQQKLFVTFERLSEYYLQRKTPEQAAVVLRRWLTFDPLHENVQYRLIEIYALMGQRSTALAQYDAYASMLESELGIAPQAELRQLYESIKGGGPIPQHTLSREPAGMLPPLPSLFIGREQAVADVKQRLNTGPAAEGSTTSQPRVVIQGWPGIGKTTLSAILAHDRDLQSRYQDGVLWISLGQDPNPMAILSNWGRALGFHELERTQTVEEASARLRAFIKDRRILLIIDDIWDIEDARPLQIGGDHSGLLMTTRLNDVARALANRPEALYKIPILSPAESLTLLRTLAPQVVAQYPAESAALAADLEGLPLALQVAGRLLHAEMEFGWGIIDLLDAIREGKRLLEAQPPADRFEVAAETTPTIAALLQRSVERLSPEMQERFALLAVFAPKPATFSLEAMQSVWRVDDARPTARILIDRGLLEPDRNGRFQMHALLVMLARSLFQD